MHCIHPFLEHGLPPSLNLNHNAYSVFTLYQCVCSTVGGLSTVGDIMSTMGGYLEYRGDIMINVGDILSTVGDIMSTVGGYLEYRGGCSVPWGIS